MPAEPAPYRDDVAESFSLDDEEHDGSRRSSQDSTSTTSLILERINRGERGDTDDPRGAAAAEPLQKQEDYDDGDSTDGDADLERGPAQRQKPMEKKARRMVYIIGGLLVGMWVLSLVVYLSRESFRSHDTPPDPAAPFAKAGKTITLDQVQNGAWRARRHSIQWIGNQELGEDGLMQVADGENALEIQDVRNASNTRVLMKSRQFDLYGQRITATKFWPSPDLKSVLLASDLESHWRHSYTARFWTYDVETGKAESLTRDHQKKLSLAQWSPKGDKIAYVEDNNVWIREWPNQNFYPVTKDGGVDLFYGIPDWVYEEEVFAGNSALWWNPQGTYLAFLRTNETKVPDYPLQYFVSRPSGDTPEPELVNYPELDFIKYPKAGAPNPVVDLQFFDVAKQEVFSVDITNDFPDDDRLITEVFWAGGSEGQDVMVRETNRESDILRVVYIDCLKRTGKVAREENVNDIDGGWLEVTQNTQYIPADPQNGRPHDGYIDTVIHEGYDHLAYFSPIDASEPVLLTKGPWEVVDAPSAVDLKNNLVYYVGTERSPIERHVYSVKLDGTNTQPLTNTSQEGRYDVSFSKGTGYALLSYNGPGIPWQRVIGTPSGDASYSKEIESNAGLAELASKYELPTFHYSTINVDGFDLQVVERRPPHFNPKKKYPVLFHVYGGPASQTVTKAFQIDFQAFVAANLEYIVVTVDGRGTGNIGRKARVAVRGNLGYWEAHDQIATAKAWAAKDYVDAHRMAIWGWSYGGFMTLKTLEQDAGQTFSYGMAVAPVTDWRFYDSIYTERYMHTPQHNADGYQNATVSNVTALAQNVRFLLMHGVADDNVHIQNSLTLLDKLDLASIENYDVHVFPDSDHSIYFHNANRMVYDRLQTWLIRAFNGEFLKLDGLRPIKEMVVSDA